MGNNKLSGFHRDPLRFKRLRVQDDVSLNDNTNVRNCLNKNIYTPGVGVLDLKGGVSVWIGRCMDEWKTYSDEWIRAYSAGGVSSRTSGGRARVGVATSRITHRIVYTLCVYTHRCDLHILYR
jgi:hypothetical protein